MHAESVSDMVSILGRLSQEIVQVSYEFRRLSFFQQVPDQQPHLIQLVWRLEQPMLIIIIPKVASFFSLVSESIPQPIIYKSISIFNISGLIILAILY